MAEQKVVFGEQIFFCITDSWDGKDFASFIIKNLYVTF